VYRSLSDVLSTSSDELEAGALVQWDARMGGCRFGCFTWISMFCVASYPVFGPDFEP